jgi:signal transduction histidine kinase
VIADLVLVIDLGALFAVTAVVGAGVWLHARWRRGVVDRGRAPATREALDRALRQIRDFAASQARFVGTLADEIRSPLATALIDAELLLASSREPATVERYANALLEDLRHLSGLVDSYLRLAQPLAQEDTSKHVPVHLHDVVMAALQRCRHLASTRDVTIVPTLAQTRDGAAVEVLGDAVLLEAMLENLLRNGVLSSPRGARVELRVELVRDQVHVAVLDRGAPIPEHELEELFQGFFAVPTPARTPPGTGLSLAIAMRVAEHHRGTISLTNAPDGGCRFEVQLPRWPGDVAPRIAS